MYLVENGHVRDTAFIVSQPLQILVALSIIKQKQIVESSYLLIVGTFYNAKMVFQRMKEVEWPMSGLAIEFFETHKAASRFSVKNNVKNYFCDGDVSLKKFFELLYLKFNVPSIRINVFEEGLGTYRADLYSGVKRNILRFLGVGTNYGGCVLTDRLYLFSPEAYRGVFPESKVKLEKILNRPIDIIILYFQSLSYIFDHSVVLEKSDEVCNVYLSSWVVDYDFLQKFSALPGDKYIKLHPRSKDEGAKDCGILVSRTAPAEMALVNFMEKYKSVVVFHHGSSVERYIPEGNITFVKI